MGFPSWYYYLIAPAYILYRIQYTSLVLTDCDEVYNYWEALHHMLFREDSSFQTWEYQYQLRSYAYLEPLRLYASFILYLNPIITKLQLFVMMKQSLAALTAMLELVWIQHVPHSSIFVALLLLFNAGMYHASSALLPSASFIQAYLICSVLFLRGQHKLFVVAAVAYTLSCAWPFGALILAPQAMHILVRERKRLVSFLSFIALVTVIIQMLVTWIDSIYYGKLVFPSWEIVRYNLFNNNDSLYGTEPLSYYLKNLILNFNIGIIGLLVLPVMIFTRQRQQHRKEQRELRTLVYPLYLWILITFPRPHKEERFLYPIYPILVFSAYYFVDTSLNFAGRVVSGLSRHKELSERQRTFCHAIIWGPVIVLSLLRIEALKRYYQEPVEQVYERVSQLEGPVTVCTAGEWYRFRSSFYLPPSSQLQFTPSSFKGQLPQHFGDNQPFNSENREESSRYVDESACDYVIELKSSRELAWENYEIIYSHPFLDAHRTSVLHRIFYIPYYHELAASSGDVIYDDYVLSRKVIQSGTEQVVESIEVD